MKSRMVEVAGLSLKITLHNNMLALSYNIDGLSIYNTSRIIRNSKLTESEFSQELTLILLAKFFSVNIKQINNIVHSNVCVYLYRLKLNRLTLQLE